MNSVWRSLLWKEWREHRWILALLAACLVGVPVVCSLRHPENIFAALSLTMSIVPVAAIFLAMHLAAREQSTGTIRFLQALPITGTKPAAAKLILGSATIVAPILLAVGAVAVWQQVFAGVEVHKGLDFDRQLFGTPWGLENWFAARTVAPSLAGVSLLIWMAAAGVNRSDEVRAGAIAFLVVISVWGLLALLAYWFQDNGDLPRWCTLLLAAAPGGLAVVDEEIAHAPRGAPSADGMGLYWPYAVAALISHAALASWFVCRFGRIIPGQVQPVERMAPVAQRAWLSPPRRYPLTAIIWKQARESGPLALLGAASIIAIAMIIAWAGRYLGDELPPSEFFAAAIGVWIMMGIGVSIVAGVGVFMDDLRPGLHTFWRSRPIGVNQWFAVKFIAGLLITVVTLAVPPLLIGGYMLMAHGADALGEMARPKHIAGSLAIGMFVQCGLYAGAVTAMVLLRQPIYAAISAIVVAVGTLVLAQFIAYGPNGHRDLALLLLCAAALMAAVLVGWLAVRKDWGWK